MNHNFLTMKHNFLRTIPKIFFVWLLIAIQACSDDPTPVLPLGSSGYFVVNEGGFNKSNTSISFYDRAANKVTNDVFAAKNGRPLGDQAQSMIVYNGKAFIAVQNSSKIEVINADDFSSIKTITAGIKSPRFFLGINENKIYVSDWGADGLTGSVNVIELNTLTVTKSIPTGKGANKMVMKGDKVYVANSGGYGTESTISVIDVTSDKVVATINTPDNPNSLAFDKDGNLWIGGNGDFVNTEPWIGKIGTDDEMDLVIDLGFMSYDYITLAMNNAGDKFYFSFAGGVYAVSTTGGSVPATPFIDKGFYGIAVDPITDEIIGTEALSFSSAGKVYVYNASGELKNSFDVGIAPNGVAFK